MRPLALLLVMAMLWGCSTSGEEPGAAATSTPSSSVVSVEPSVVSADPSVVSVDPSATDVLAPGEGGPSLVLGDGFTVTFPVPPNDRAVEIPVGDGLVGEARIYQAQVEGVFLAFSYADTPGEGPVDAAAAEESLLESARSAAADADGELVEQTLTEVAGRTAVDYVVAFAGGTLRGIALFDGPRLYTMQSAGAGDGTDRALLDDLAASFTLG